MRFGEIVHEEHYYDVFPGLLELVKSVFKHIESGVQGDAWIWIFENNEKVALDTFTSMHFQLKAEKSSGLLIEKVISVLGTKYNVFLYEEPELEGHEDLS